MEKKLLIFDADGTIWDSEKDVFLSFNRTLRVNGQKEVSKEEFQKLAGLDLKEMFERVLPAEEKENADEYKKQYRKYYIDEGHYVDATTLFKDVKKVLDEFKDKGFYMAIASGKPKRVLDKMVSHFELDGFCYVLGIGESNFKHKPDPEIVNYIMDELQINREDTVMIGDSASDILAGKNAGIDTIAVTYGFDKPENLSKENPTYMIDEFSKLSEIIKLK